mmetsp:Transcript_4681/g.9800  ORF Transcript_4681/g.9800 Transcript_4681/m.9800 type:complete len:278 (-) Transcript_4681:471-1304(-)
MGAIVAKAAFLPPPCGYQNEDVTSWVRTTSGEVVPLKLVSPAAASLDPSQSWFLLWSHGNAEDLSSSRHLAQVFADELRLTVALYDYCGYGLATGKPREDGLYSSIDAVLQHLLDNGAKLDHIFLYGKSVGSVPTVRLAMNRKFAVRSVVCACAQLRFLSSSVLQGVVLVSALASGARVVFPNSNSSVLDRVFGPNLSRVCRVQSPLLILHGTDDTVIPCHHSRLLAKRVADERNSKKDNCAVVLHTIEGADHNDIESTYFQLYFDFIKNFISQRKC